MKLRNKKTGEIVEYISFKAGGSKILFYVFDTAKHYYYNSLAELNKEWEDYEEPKEDYIRVIDSFIDYVEEADESFECDESVHKFIEKLKAYKRLKDKGFRFNGYDSNYNHWHINFTFDNYCTGEPHSATDDLDLLFKDDHEQ